MKKRSFFSILILTAFYSTLAFASTDEKVSPINKNNPDFKLNSSQLDLEKLKEYQLPIILDFGSANCPPCRKMYPTLEKINQQMKGKAIIKYFDVWKYPQTSMGFPLEVIPTQFFFNADGTPFFPQDPDSFGMILFYAEDGKTHLFTGHKGGLTEAQFKTILKEMGVE